MDRRLIVICFVIPRSRMEQSKGTSYYGICEPLSNM